MADKKVNNKTAAHGHKFMYYGFTLGMIIGSIFYNDMLSGMVFGMGLGSFIDLMVARKAKKEQLEKEKQI